MFGALKEIGKMLDDFEAAEADIRSGDLELQKHGLEMLATLYTSLAKRAPLPRLREMMEAQADAAREQIDGLEKAAQSRKLWREAFERQDSAKAKRRESVEAAHRRVGQADLFPSHTVKDTE